MTLEAGQGGGSPARPPAFTIAQTGHSGSAYTASVLWAAGIACGHEQWWTMPGGERVDGLDGDSSWLALTAPEFRDYRGVVFHQVREPLACIGSLARHYAETPPDNPYLLRRLRHVIATSDDGMLDIDRVRERPVQLAAITWLMMNRAASRRAAVTWRVESFNAAHVMAVAAAAGIEAPDLAAVRTALRAVRRDLNAHGRIGLTWSDLCDQVDGIVFYGVQVAAAMFGYEVPE